MEVADQRKEEQKAFLSKLNEELLINGDSPTKRFEIIQKHLIQQFNGYQILYEKDAKVIKEEPCVIDEYVDNQLTKIILDNM